MTYFYLSLRQLTDDRLFRFLKATISKIFVNQADVSGGGRQENEESGGISSAEIKAAVLQGDFDTAKALYGKLPRKDISDPYILFVSAKIKVDQNLLEEAVSIFERVEVLCPELPSINFALGNVALSRNDLSSALARYRKQLQLDPDMAMAWVNYGVALTRSEDYPAARKVLLKACDLLQGNDLPKLKLARVHYLEQRYDLAREILASLDGEDKETDELKIAVLLAEENYSAAIDQLKKMEARASDDARVQMQLGFAWNAFGDYERALYHYLQSVKLDPYFVDALSNLGVLYRDLGQFDDAKGCFEKVIEIDSEHRGALWGLSLHHLSMRRYEEGWRNYENRVYCDDYSSREFQLPRWTGELRSGLNLLVSAEQGLGDEIMFASCIPDLLNAEINVAYECHPKLGALFARSFPEVEVVAREQSLTNKWIDNYPNLEATIPAGSLPRIFRNTELSFPDRRGFLKADEEKVKNWRHVLGGLGNRPKIGISWQGGKKQTKSAFRSIPLWQWESLLRLDIDFISLQYTDCREEIDEVKEKFGVKIHHWQNAIDDYDETAALVKALDLVVSVQTALVHLAGALGAPTIAMISAAPEWRYGASGEAMSWYSSVRLLRQSQINEWRDVIGQARDKITQEFPESLTFANR